jgi:collagenase-like PrtC family protease
MEMTVPQQPAAVTLGPILFNWRPERWRDFYFRIADEAEVDAVYLGEVVCSKRAPLFEPHLAEAVDRLEAAGKTVVYASLAQVALKFDRHIVDQMCSAKTGLIEANDSSALLHLSGRPHHIGPFVNVYNERTAAYLARGGAQNFCLPFEMPAAAIRVLCERTRDLDATIEAMVFGRVPLALSARCYHARAHSRSKDSCQYVCDEDPDGLELDTLDGQPFLTVNGIQTLSYDYLNLIQETPELRAMGVSRFRLSPHDCDMVEVAAVFRAVVDERIAVAEGAARLAALQIKAPFSNGFYYGKPGHVWNATATLAAGKA